MIGASNAYSSDVLPALFCPAACEILRNVQNSELPAAVLELIRTSIPTMDALEILIFMAVNSGRAWSAAELREGMAPSVVSDAVARETLKSMKAGGLLTSEGEAFRFGPASRELAAACDGLLQAYNERPVTLIRSLYAIADGKKIQAFADAFRIRKDP